MKRTPNPKGKGDFMMKKEIIAFLKKHYKSDFEVKNYNVNGKYHEMTLVFDNDEEIDILIKERKGNNGNYRIVLC